MDEVEVDPQLFVKCRLCLKDTGGMFQIVPRVQDQIKFCFDIEVKHFDGLPQLICKGCRTTLTEYNNTKMTFIENQKSLKSDICVKQEIYVQNQDEPAKPTVCHSPQQTTVTSSQEIDGSSTYIHPEAKDTAINDVNIERKEYASLKVMQETDGRLKENVNDDLNKNDDEIKMLKHKRKRSFLRLSSESSEDVNQRKSASYLVKQKDSKSENKISWKCHFSKRLICLLCQKHCKTRGNLTGHLSKHEKFLAEHADVFAKCCIVKMNKIDSKPNMTGTLSKVVYAPNKITGHGHKANIPYYVVYSPKEKNMSLPLTISEPAESSEDDNAFKKRGLKRARLLSRSSNETVVLEKDSKTSSVFGPKPSKIKTILPETELTECINIDDSSSSDMDITRNEIDNTVKPKYTDYNKIQTIISICKNKYLKKIETLENDVQAETLLKHKILNMGRKVINKQGFNCTGLLRFMEHKNLDIIWNSTDFTPMNSINKDTNYVRIMPKLKGKEKLKNEKWSKIPETQEKGIKDQNVDDNVVSVEEVNSTVTIGLPIIASSETISIHTENDQAMLYANSEIEINKNKLLNANPVANPKQLPKKLNALENKASNRMEIQNCIQPYEQPCSSEQENTELSMPIITSTTSLAAPSTTEKEAVPNCSVVNEVEKSAPRIKVKPVSELMSERVLKNLTQQQIDFPSNIWNTNSEINDSVQQLTSNLTVAATDVSPASSVIPPINEKINYPQSTNSEYLILHTPELPNQKTEWPFKYLKELLYIHNIILLDPNEAIPKNFTCLIKFKLQYKQENVAQPVVLVITFSCSGKTYHLGVKHSGQENIDLNQLPVNWQWEILNKIYQEEVVNKVLKNAQKVNNATYEYTKRFFCLLKSIQCKKVN